MVLNIRISFEFDINKVKSNNYHLIIISMQKKSYRVMHAHTLVFKKETRHHENITKLHIPILPLLLIETLMFFVIFKL